MEDLPGFEPLDRDWLDLDGGSDSLKELLTEIDRVYEPYLIANAAAAGAHQTQFDPVIDGAPWAQNTFAYQVKCLQLMRGEFAALDSSSEAQIVALAVACGFLRLLAEPS